MIMDYITPFLEWILNCDFFANNKIFLNQAQAEDQNLQIVTNQIYHNEMRYYADGGVLKRIRYTINCYLAINDNQLVKTDIENSENIDSLNALNEIVSYVKEQENEQNYPDFGEDIEVQTIYPEYESPSTPIIDNDSEPSLALYTIPVVCEVLVYE